jgi:hypothetical protein
VRRNLTPFGVSRINIELDKHHDDKCWSHKYDVA